MSAGLISIIIVSLPIILLGFKYLGKKFGFFNLIIVTLPMHRFFIDVGFSLKPYLIFSIPFIIGGFFKKIREPRINYLFYDRSVVGLTFFFLLFLAVSTVVSGSSFLPWRYFFLIIWGIIIVLFFCRQITGYPDIEKMLDAYLFSGFISGLAGIFFYLRFFLNPSIAPLDDRVVAGVYQTLNYGFGRLTGFDRDPNSNAMYLVCFLAVFISAFWRNKYKSNKGKAYLAAGILILFTNLVLTFSRTGMVAFLFVLFLFWFFRIFRFGLARGIVYMFLGLVASSLIAVTAILVYDAIFSNRQVVLKNLWEAIFSRSYFYESRFILWKSGWEMFLQHPWFGMGLGTSAEETYFFIGRPTGTHNTYITLLAETGIFSAILFFALISRVLTKLLACLSTISEDREVFFGYLGILAGFMSVLVFIATINLFTTIFLWFQLGLVVTFINLTCKKRCSN